MQDEKIRVGIVGAGAVARLCHLPNYLLDPRVEVVGIVDINQERAQELADEFGVPAVYPSTTELLSEGRATCISVCVANAFHAPIVLEALQGGADVLVEKPMTLTTKEAAEVAAAVKESGRLLMVGMTNRFGLSSEVLARYAKAGAFGNLYYARAAMLRRRGNPAGWFTNSKLSGGGAMMDIGVHAIDLAWYLLGRPRPVRVSAVMRREIAPYETEYVSSWPTADRPPDGIFDVEDFMTAFIRFENGATLEVAVAWAVNGPETQLTVDLYGNKGGASLNPLKIYTETAGVLSDVEPVVRVKRDPYTEEFAQWVEAVATRGDSPVPVEDGVMVVSMLEAIRRSAAEGCEVEVPQVV